MRASLRSILLSAALCLLTTSTAFGGAIVTFGDGARLDLGFRIQILALQSQEDLDGDGDFEGVQDLLLRRARFRLRATLDDRLSCFMQTALNGVIDGAGRSMRTTDARLEYTAGPWARFHVGLHKVPSSRQELTPASTRLAIDRAALAGKVLNRSTGVLTMFANGSYDPGASGIRGDEGIRDLGVTLYATRPLAADVHLKYYLGIYDGVQAAGHDAERYAGRVQLNLGDSEDGFSLKAYHLGTRRTFGLGLSFDTQRHVAADADGGTVDYAALSADAFLERPVGGGVLTLEGGYTALDLGGDVRLVTPATTTEPAVTRDLRTSQGDGYYVQAGYLFDRVWQPWAEYESWTSDDDDGTGGYVSLRAGLSRYLQGHNLNLKIGVERFTPEVPFSPDEDTLTSVVCGVFLTY